MRKLVGLSALLVLLGVAAPATAQAPGPAEELLRLVPDAMSLCLVVQDLRGHWARFQKSPWPKAIKESPWGAALLDSPEVKKLGEFVEKVSERLSVTWPQVRDDILGDAVVLGYRQGAGADDEQGVLLLKARKADLLARLVDRINKEQTKAGELKRVVEQNYNGVKYYRREEIGKNHFYFLQGPLLAFTGREETLRQVMDLQAKPGKEPRLLQQLQRAGVVSAPKNARQGARPLAALWVNPRTFDGEMQQRLGKAGPAEAHALKQFVKLWSAVDALVLSFTPDRELELSLTVQARAQNLPQPVQRFFTAPTKPSELWQRFPDNAMLTVAGRVDFPALVETIGQFVPAAERKSAMEKVQAAFSLAGLDVVKDVLPNLGPEWGICVDAAPDPKDFPHVLAALAVKPVEKEVYRELFRGLQFLSRLALLGYNEKAADRIQLKTMRQGDVEVHYLVQNKLFPQGVQPAFALKDGYLLLASCPEAIRRFEKSDRPAPVGDAPLLRLSLVETAKLLKQHREALKTWLAEKNQIPPKAAGMLIDSLVAALAPFDRVTLTQRTGDGQAVWTLRLAPSARE